ncbi:MAG: DUF971 domain-containing protein [Candidatus Accumulibacter sp.]|jgi:DUF971 family protein|nr:DUF971 domain-containing protein [Accumulibacter sp.]
MTGLSSGTPIPLEIRRHDKSRTLEFVYDDASYELSDEFLRVFTPSAEARGHAPGQEVLQTGKRDVKIESIEPVGNYAIRPLFSDGHRSGIYSWDIVHFLCVNADALWRTYLARLASQGATRDPEAGAAPLKKSCGRCGGH